MIFWQTLLQSLRLPKKEIVFKLNRTGMDITVIYMFILLFIASIPALTDRIYENSGFSADMNIVFLLIYFFIFYYLPLTIIIFLSITVISYVMTWISHFMHRKLRLQILWKMCAYTTTIPFLLYTGIALFFPVHDIYLWISVLYILTMLIAIISVYPKRKPRKK
ncbi:hypothetical protein GMD78_07075 [Ornithinibacillus sp. L9]|uniref:DUF1189 domain-containing protein n=1 Tax=Ornithinibacillus caprae TaxID=2678566 RepID=A0A6N8FFE0_9BACI|nr:hypothetical protein [Ornithinibacillus caprae]MUK88155.1 hypothetical protein [Ornithinibacillus caprae]